MRRRVLLTFFGSVTAGAPLDALAQQRSTVPRIGVLMGADPSAEFDRLAAFREALAGLGYVEGRNVEIHVRYAEGNSERFDVLARELVALAPAVIACVGRKETAAAQAATSTIPIVFFQAADPVENGFVQSLGRPGGHTTGFTLMSAELDRKRLELLHEIAPMVKRAVFLINPSFNPGLSEQLATVEAAAQRQGMVLRRIDATSSAELSDAFAAIQTSASQALLVQNDAFFATQAPTIISFAFANRLPTIYEDRGAVLRGALMSYSANHLQNARLAAGYVDRILKGTKPADLPVQLPTVFQLVINLKTAEALGLKIPPSTLARADEVVE